jgi:hypothetical protein
MYTKPRIERGLGGHGGAPGHRHPAPLFASAKDQNPLFRQRAGGCFVPGHVLDGAWDISGNSGLVSEGRINKDTPPLTTPGHTSKSSAMDISSHIFQIVIHGHTPRHFRPEARPARYDSRPEAYLCSRNTHEGGNRHFLARILT